jgi:hypothetical protein
MIGNQIVIQIILIAVFAVFAIVLLLPGRGARKLALRRLALVVVLAAAVVAVIFPELVNSVANLVGVGRGTDLILYALVIVFIGNSVSASVRHRQLEREVTILARKMALEAAPKPNADGGHNKAQTRSPSA